MFTATVNTFPYKLIKSMVILDEIIQKYGGIEKIKTENKNLKKVEDEFRESYCPHPSDKEKRLTRRVLLKILDERKNKLNEEINQLKELL